MSVYIILAILAFSVLILSHEFGHFIMAKLNDVKVEEFSLGMGPKLFGVKGKETEYLIKALPIGGYVKMLGEAMTGEEEVKTDDPRAFANKSAVRRLSIVAAGPIMNLILAALVYVIIGYGQGFAVPEIASFSDVSPAREEKLMVGDRILEVNNKKVTTWEDLSTEIITNKENTVNLIVKRGSETLKFSIKPIKDEQEDRYIIGVVPAYNHSPSIGQSLSFGFKETKTWINLTLSSFKQLFTGKASLGDVGGPVTIIRASGAAAQAGIWPLLSFMAFLSINLAIFNIIPFPALDGGWIFLCLFEIITRRKIDEKKVAVANYIGFTLLMILMVVVLIKDILFPIKL
ncbi:MAG: RIP metalloprotease RseP [Bacillota bacterium]|nr:RIP metalloprotease RseP [Bacillota bacterium]